MPRRGRAEQHRHEDGEHAGIIAGVDRNQVDDENPERNQAEHEPGGEADPRSDHALPQDHQQDATARGADGDADADLASSAADRIRDEPVRKDIDSGIVDSRGIVVNDFPRPVAARPGLSWLGDA
jgi:hypothetical protein